MPEINPDRDLKTIRGNLVKAKDYIAKPLEDIDYQLDMLEAVSPYWEHYKAGIPIEGPVVSSGAVVLHEWAGKTEEMVTGAQTLSGTFIVGSNICSSAGSVTATLAQFGGEMDFVSKDVTQVLDKRLGRSQIREALKRIDPVLGGVFVTAYEYTTYPVSDPGRGPYEYIVIPERVINGN